MILYPAIDLIGGQAVRLLRGDYAQMTVYDQDPVQTALRFEQAGAEHLHLVDLEGARDGAPRQMDVIRAIAGNTHLEIEAGGGIRDMAAIEGLLHIGVRHVILGTAALKDAALLKNACAAFGGRIVVGVDVKDGFVAVQGWAEISAVRLDEFLRRLNDIGVSRVICTDIGRDGTMGGANAQLYQDMLSLSPIPVTASGGVSSLAEIRKLSRMGLHSAIIGRALYEGKINLKEAIESMEERPYDQ